MKHPNRILRAALALILPFAAFACGEDGASTFTLALTVDSVSLTADGSDFARVRATVLDQNGYPPPIGSSVFLQASGGNVNQTGAETGDSFTDAVGTAQFTVACTGEGEIQAIGLYEGNNGFLSERISCAPAPTGDWTLSVSAQPRRVQLRSAAQVTVAGLQETGAAVPVGTAIRLDIVDGSGVTFQNGLSTQLRTTEDQSGSFTATVLTGDFETEANVCASFVDQRFGSTNTCVILVVSPVDIEGPICIGAYSNSNPPADGESITSLTFTVFNVNSAPVPDADIDAELTAGALLEEETDDGDDQTISLITDTNGDAVAYIRSPNQAGSANLNATAEYTNATEGNVTLECELPELTFAPPPDCLFVPDRFPMDPPIIGVRDGGRAERGALRACFTDIGGVPISGGRRVEFTLVAGHTDSTLVATRALTDFEGCADTEIKAGDQAGTVEVRANLEFGENASSCTTGPLSIRGGRPSAADFVLHCDAENLGSLVDTRGTEVRSTCEIPCYVYAADRFGNSLPDRTNNDQNQSQQTSISELSVFFATEQGIISSPGLDVGGQFIETAWIPRGDIPTDVLVDSANGESNGPGTGIGAETNPRDGLVTLIAYTTGEEQFFDENGNGIYDEGERFVDLPEPFIDLNDNNTYDPELGERYFEVNTSVNPADGVWSAGNGVWDDVTTIWTQTHVLLTGSHYRSEADPVGLHGFFGPGGQLRSPQITVPAAGSSLVFRPTDVNGNTTSPATSFAVETSCERLAISETVSTSDRFGHFEVAQGYDYLDAGGNSVDFTDPWIFSRPRISIDHDPVADFIQTFALGLTATPGPLETCSLSIAYSTREDSACGRDEGSTFVFAVQIPQVVDPVGP